MEPVLKKNHIPYRIAAAVIFPELVRYSALRDKMETTLLKALYINLGEEYANFSIGQFQVKPSFANAVRQRAKESLKRKAGISLSVPSDFDNASNYRKSIINDLEDPRREFSYVIAFIKICENEFRLRNKDDYSLVKFLASAYNCGINKTEQEIMDMSVRKFFHTGIVRTTTYSYSEISLFWYKNARF